MRVVPVIDLKRGTAVHAVRGERERYRPIGDPLSLARRFRLEELYVADLDAITGTGDNDAVIRALTRRPARGSHALARPAARRPATALHRGVKLR